MVSNFLFLRSPYSSNQRLGAGGNSRISRASLPLDGISRMLQSYQSAIEMLLNEDFHLGVSAEELEMFKNQFRTSAYTCRLRSCPRATIGFETDLLRYEHEMAHAGGFRCTYSDCQYPPFPSSKALKAHVSSCHNIVPEWKSIRRVGALRAPHQQQNMNGQRIPPQSNNAGAVPNAQPGGQAPQGQMVPQTVPMQARSGPQVLQGMPPQPPVTPQDIQNLRARLAPAQAKLPEDQLRQFITNQRVARWKKQQAQRQMQQGLQGQANQIPQQPMLQQPLQQTLRPTQAPPQPTPTKQPNKAPQPPKSAQQPAPTNVKQGVKRPNDDVIEVSNPEQASGTITASQAPNSQQTSSAQAQNSATMDRNALITQKDARFKMLGAEIDRTLPRNPPITHPPEVRAQMQQWLRYYFPQLKQLDKCLLFYNRIADNPEPILKQMFEAVRLK